MKKIITLLLAAAMMTASCAVLTACGNKDKKKDAEKATTAVSATVAATQAAAQPATNAPQQQDQQQATAAPDNAATQASAQASDVYAGKTAEQAKQAALDYAGSGYEAVSAEQKYLRNREAWLIGVKAFTTDSTIYYIYVLEDEAVPQTDIPDRGNGQEGVYGGLTLDQAMQAAKEYAGGDWAMVSSEQKYLRNQEAWLIGASRDGGETIYYLYVNENGVVPQEELPQ